MTVIATYNLKGGVGKTATATNLAWLAARAGYRTLLWDLDPQGAATFYFRVQPKLRGGGKRLAAGELDVGAAVRATDFPNLDLLPADFRCRTLDALLASDDRPRDRLQGVIDQVRQDYDLILLDCPPSIGRTTENVFALADALLVPLIPTTLSVRTLEQVTAFVAEHRPGDLPILPFFTLVDPRKRLHTSIVEEAPQRWPALLGTWIPCSSQVEQMGVMRQPVGAFAPRCKAAVAYEALWAELASRLAL
jgi:chromosome partitioning protein